MAGPASACPLSVDQSLGPWAGPHCRGAFDFTLLFEESILSLSVSCLFLVLIPDRLFKLSSNNVEVTASPLRWAKAVRSKIQSNRIMSPFTH